MSEYCEIHEQDGLDIVDPLRLNCPDCEHLRLSKRIAELEALVLNLQESLDGCNDNNREFSERFHEDQRKYTALVDGLRDAAGSSMKAHTGCGGQECVAETIETIIALLPEQEASDE